MQLCSRCNAAVEVGRSHCPICDQPVGGTPDATWVQGGPPTLEGPPTPAAGTPQASPYAPVPASHPQAGYHQGYAPAVHPQAPVYGPAPAYAPVAVPVYGVGVPVAMPPRSKAAAALLCFFLGSLGIHRFYTGQVGLGLALLLTTVILAPLTCGAWLAVTAVWVLVDFVLILTDGVTDQWGRPLT